MKGWENGKEREICGEKEVGTDGRKEENADRSRKISMKVEKYRM